jgi:hypothetical protein
VAAAPPIYPGLIVPSADDPNSIVASIQSMQAMLNTLAGNTGGTGWANQTIIKRKSKDTDPDPVGTKDGDRWLQPPLTGSQNWIEKVWVGGQWRTRDSGTAIQIPKPIGSSGQVLTSNGTDAVWGSPVQMVSTETGAVATGATIIPLDDTIPQSNEGDQYMSLSITPKSATSKLLVEVVFNGSCSDAGGAAITVALFRDSGANAIAASTTTNSALFMTAIPLRHVESSGSTTTTTFKVRVGTNASGTVTFNGQSGGRKLGGAMASSIVIREYV